MTKLLIGVVAIAAVAFGLLSFTQHSRIDALEKSKDKGKLTWYAEMAKAKGEREVLINASLVRYSVPRTFDDVLANSDVVVAEVIGSIGFSADTDIRTWHKFKLLETLSVHTIECPTCPPIPEPPTEMLPLNRDEFLLPQYGGELFIDGIKIKSKSSQFPPFEVGKQYLLFLSFDSNQMAAVSRMGPWGTFESKNGKLQIVDTRLKHPLRDELDSRFDGSLTMFRTHLKKNHSPKQY